MYTQPIFITSEIILQSKIFVFYPFAYINLFTKTYKKVMFENIKLASSHIVIVIVIHEHIFNI